MDLLTQYLDAYFLIMYDEATQLALAVVVFTAGLWAAIP